MIGFFFKVEFIEATTTVSGNQSGTWSLVSSPYIVTDTVIVPTGKTLVIEPKVEVKFATNTALMIQGTLNACGTEIGTITFTGLFSTTPGHWQGIKFIDNPDKGTLGYSVVEYAKQAVYLENVSGITITHNIIRNNKGDYGGNGQNQLPGETGGIGAGIYLLSSSNNTIIGNFISNNQGGKGGTGDDFGSGGRGGIGAGIYLSSSPNNTLSGNIISNSAGGESGLAGNGGCSGNQGNGYGIYITSNSYNNIIDTANTYNNEPIHYYWGITLPTIIEYQTLTLAGSGSTNLGRIVLINCSNFTIRNNYITGGIGENGKTGSRRGRGDQGGIGAGIYLLSSSNVTIANNTLSNNQGGQGGTDGNQGSGGTGGIGTGIYLGSSTNNIIITANNTIYNNQGGYGGNAGYLGSSGAGGIGTGIYLDSSPDNTIIGGNIIYNNQGGGGGKGTDWATGGSGGIGTGIYLGSSTGNTIRDNIISKNQGGCGETGGSWGSGGSGGIGAGVYLGSSIDNTIRGNTISNNQGGQGGRGGSLGSGGRGGIGTGIHLDSSINNIIIDNPISNNSGGQGGPRGAWGSDGRSGNGFGVYIDSNSYNNTIFSSNIYNGEPIHYYYGITTSITIEYQTLTLAGSGSTNLARIVLINCSNFTIRNNYIAGGMGENGQTGGYGGLGNTGGIGTGIYLGSSTNNTITSNIICDNQGGYGGSGGLHGSGGTGGIGTGIYLGSSTNNTISDNIIYNNQGGQYGQHGYEGSDGAGGTGIGIYLSWSDNNKIIRNNTIKDNLGSTGNPNGSGIGIYCKSSLISECIYNNIYNNQTYNLQTDISPGTQVAEYNYWGSDPPATYTFSGNIDYEPWLTESVPKIIIVPSSGIVGTLITVSGEDFGSTELIRIDFGTTQTITTVTTNAGGTFSTVFTINLQPYGTTTIRAIGLSSNKTASNSFHILSNIILLTPYCGTVGTMVTIRGNGFGASELIKVELGKTPTIQMTPTSAYGSWTTVFTIDTQPYGTTTIKVIGLKTQAEAMNYFFILPNIILLTPSIGTVGSIVTIAGNGFSKLEGIRVDFGTTFNICMVSSTMDGSFTTVFTIDTQPYGTTSIIATGLTSVSKAFTLFKILPKITAFPTSGQVGSLVTVAGNGFGASELVRFAFGNTPTITTGSTNSRGEFQIVFSVNNQPIGTTTIMANGLRSGGSTIANFYILPFTILKITPSLQNIALGSTFTTQVELLNVVQLFGGDIHLKFDPNILEVIQIGSGTFPANPMITGTFSNTTGWIHYGFFLFSPASATGSGVVCNIVFKGITGGKSDVVFESEGNHKTKLLDTNGVPILWTKQEAFYRVIDKVSVEPEETIVKAVDALSYTGLAYYGTNTMDVTGSTTFTASGGGSFTVNIFLAKYMGTYTITGEYLGFIGTTTVIIIPGTPTTLVYVSGNNQVNTCTLTLKEPFVVKVVDSYGNPCADVEVNWEISSIPVGATGYALSSTRTTTNICGTASSFLTLGTEPPGTYTIQAISILLSGSPCPFSAYSLRRFGNIAGICLIDLGGTRTLGSISVMVKIVELNTTTTTQNSSFFFEKIPVGSYTLNLDTTGASPANVVGVRILTTQFEDTTDAGTISLLAGDVTNDGQVNIDDWPVIADAWTISATSTMTQWQTKYIEADFDHNDKVNIDDIYIFSQNFGRQQTTYKCAKKIKSMTSSGKIELSFNLETLEGVDLENLRIGDIINLKIYLREAKGCLGGEIHLSFNPQVLQVISEKIIPGDYPTADIENSRYKFEFKNSADNSLGVIDYAVGITTKEPGDGGLLAIVPFKIISNNAYSKIGCDFKEEENRQTMFIEQTGNEEELTKPKVEPDEIIIRVPPIYSDLINIRVYPNPARKGQEVTFDQLTSDKLTTLRIYNLLGELVYEKEGKNAITWNLKNKDGEEVTSGIYIYFLKDELGATKKGKVGVIK